MDAPVFGEWCVLCAKMVGVPFKLKVFRAIFAFLHEDFKRENNDINNTYSGLSTVYPLCPVFCLLTKTSWYQWQTNYTDNRKVVTTNETTNENKMELKL